VSALGRYGALMLGVLTLAGCEEKNQGSSLEATSAPVASAVQAQVGDDGIAVPEDFEDQAASEINDDNAEQELSKLEQEVSTE
jgi:hypothetical protein